MGSDDEQRETKQKNAQRITHVSNIMSSLTFLFIIQIKYFTI